ncbi:hypothetical protein VB713_20660 [Anabaena cylindrica UHCC 0172]|uniref:hypothetical protein n=1 Tax=Anabaena cylindrica TaxID=1165 RepID=UPI002B22119E|nr:hypothetical protein [Anabaena cylindrica]MEA5553354.1 hypothetical protein [Anabaena cylindrica UHCC 0172]
MNICKTLWHGINYQLPIFFSFFFSFFLLPFASYTYGTLRERGSFNPYFSAAKEYQSPITNYQSPITNYQLPITNHQLPITNHQLPITNH